MKIQRRFQIKEGMLLRDERGDYREILINRYVGSGVYSCTITDIEGNIEDDDYRLCSGDLVGLEVI